MLGFLFGLVLIGIVVFVLGMGVIFFIELAGTIAGGKPKKK